MKLPRLTKGAADRERQVNLARYRAQRDGELADTQAALDSASTLNEAAAALLADAGVADDFSPDDLTTGIDYRVQTDIGGHGTITLTSVPTTDGPPTYAIVRTYTNPNIPQTATLTLDPPEAVLTRAETLVALRQASPGPKSSPERLAALVQHSLHELAANPQGRTFGHHSDQMAAHRSGVQARLRLERVVLHPNATDDILATIRDNNAAGLACRLAHAKLAPTTPRTITTGAPTGREVRAHTPTR